MAQFIEGWAFETGVRLPLHHGGVDHIGVSATKMGVDAPVGGETRHAVTMPADRYDEAECISALREWIADRETWPAKEVALKTELMLLEQRRKSA